MTGQGDAASQVPPNEPSSKGKLRSRRRRLVFESLGQRRLLAVISGSVFHDLDGSMRPDPSEVRLDSRLVYIDANQNTQLDTGEPFAIADAAGRFRFDDLATGTYSVRLFDGSSGQRQTFPTAANQTRLPSSFENPLDAVLAGGQLNVLTADTLLQIDTAGTRTTQVAFDFQASGLVTAVAADASSGLSAVIVAGTFTELGENRSGLWLVPANGGPSSLLQYDSNPLAFAASTSAIGADGHGLVIAGGDDADAVATIHSLQISQATTTLANGLGVRAQVVSTGVTVPADTQVVSSASSVELSNLPAGIGSRTVVAWPVDGSATDDGAALRTTLWSNSAADWIAGSETVLAGATELISFDDAAGLLAVRYAQGDIGILDVDAGFAPLQQFASIHGPTTFVPGEDVIVSLDTNESESALLLHDIRSGRLLASHPIDVSALGAAMAILPGATIDTYFVLGETGSAAIKLRKPSSHQIDLAAADQEVEIAFGVQVDGSNVAPAVIGNRTIAGREDTALRLDASQIAAMVADADRDRLISLIVIEPEHGVVRFEPDGGLIYQPEADFNGDDSFAVQFHDGQSPSQPIHFNLTIASVPDPPSGIQFLGSGIPEHTEGPYEVGSINVLDADGGGSHTLGVYDSRFRIENGVLVLIRGGLDFEFEPEIMLTIAGFDNASGDYFYDDIIVMVEDENDPIDYVYADPVTVAENDEGAFVANLGAFDYDQNQVITFSVDDDRFEVIGNQLWLKADESIDYETESLVVLTITADDHAGSTVSTELRLPIMDVPEAIGQITLSNQTVLELEPGETVGEVQLDGVPATSNYQLAVDDPRFEIVGSTLKLLDEHFVRRSAAEQIELTITAQDTAAVFAAISATFVIEVLENDSPFHNDENPCDVDGNGVVSPLDALAIINYLNIYGPGPVGPGDPGYGYDVNGDGQVTALDALLVINHLNTLQNNGTVGGEGRPPGKVNGDGINSDSPPPEQESPAESNGPLAAPLSDRLPAVNREFSTAPIDVISDTTGVEFESPSSYPADLRISIGPATTPTHVPGSDLSSSKRGDERDSALMDAIDESIRMFGQSDEFAIEGAKKQGQ